MVLAIVLPMGQKQLRTGSLADMSGGLGPRQIAEFSGI
jgi:hypothetical protein